jgi:hypothetical protein
MWLTVTIQAFKVDICKIKKTKLQQELVRMHKKLKKRKQKQRPKETNKMEYKEETLNISGIR